ncbi:hypothetical protein VTO42DRAFT_889 [Malbranchea cinnamomea]
MRSAFCRQASQLRLDKALARYSPRLFYSTVEIHSRPCDSSKPQKPVTARAGTSGNPRHHRVEVIKSVSTDVYPRWVSRGDKMLNNEFRKKFEYLEKGQTAEGHTVFLFGRLQSQRIHGNKLFFLDAVHLGNKIQIVGNYRILEQAGVTLEQFKDFYHSSRRGDSYGFVGKPCRTEHGELSLKLVELPHRLSPCLHDVPLDAKDRENSPYERHVQLLADPSTRDILVARARIIQEVRRELLEDSFVEVSTPILASVAGGAIAQPFLTSATEFPERSLAMRIAPELWLKRMITGGFDKVFEIGPQFRNEGLDKTHNPEFTTCEFYETYTDLESLMKRTQKLLQRIATEIMDLNSIKRPNTDFSSEFRRIDFIPAIEEAIGEKLPDLKAEGAASKVSSLLDRLSIPRPCHPTLPRMLDRLCSKYLEPQCKEPAFIINHPECMSPLAKSFKHPTCNQVVSARAELFIEGQELANMYEEENSPFEQRRKFEEQLLYHDPETPREIDEEYVKVLEWGLPPTGGWGCGLDRLVMFFTGAKRISDVLSFGNLRSVTRSTSSEPEEKADVSQLG